MRNHLLVFILVLLNLSNASANNQLNIKDVKLFGSSCRKENTFWNYNSYTSTFKFYTDVLRVDRINQDAFFEDQDCRMILTIEIPEKYQVSIKQDPLFGSVNIQESSFAVFNIVTHLSDIEFIPLLSSQMEFNGPINQVFQTNLNPTNIVWSKCGKNQIKIITDIWLSTVKGDLTQASDHLSIDSAFVYRMEVKECPSETL